VRIAECPSTFTNLSSVRGCYKVLNRNLTWTDAGLECRSLHRDAHLLVINGAQEQAAVAGWLASASVSTWIYFVLLPIAMPRLSAECARNPCLYFEALHLSVEYDESPNTYSMLLINHPVAWKHSAFTYRAWIIHKAWSSQTASFVNKYGTFNRKNVSS